MSEEGENEDDKWITVTGKGKHKNLVKPKLKPTLHNAFAIISKPDDPTSYKISRPTLKMDDDKTILPPDLYKLISKICIFEVTARPPL